MDVKLSTEFEALRSARWFAGKGREIASVARADELGAGGRRLALLDVAYGEGDGERYLWLGDDAPGLWPPLLATLVREGALQGERGRLELDRGPALADLLPGPGAAEAVVSLDQSNSLTALGDRLLVKAYRLLRAGAHPEVELCAALAERGAPVPAFAGAIRHVAPDGTDTAVALLQELVSDAESGWEALIARVAEALGGGSARPAPGDLADPNTYRRAGAATAAVHGALADAFGTAAPPEAGERALRAARATLASAERVDPLAAERAPAALRALEPLARSRQALQRIHGDLHVGQLLFAGDRVLVIDFEGDPLRDLEARRAMAAPLRDVASLLRSIDHLGTAAARRTGADPSGWTAAARDAAIAGYEQDTGVELDRELLHAFEVASDLGTLVYARRVVPEWAYAPRRGLEGLLP